LAKEKIKQEYWKELAASSGLVTLIKEALQARKRAEREEDYDALTTSIPEQEDKIADRLIEIAEKDAKYARKSRRLFSNSPASYVVSDELQNKREELRNKSLLSTGTVSPFGLMIGALGKKGLDYETMPKSQYKRIANMSGNVGKEVRKEIEMDKRGFQFNTGGQLKRYNEGRMIGKGGMLFDPTDPTDVALLGLGMAPIPGARVAAGAGKLGKMSRKLKKSFEPGGVGESAAVLGASSAPFLYMASMLDRSRKEAREGIEGKTIEQLIEDKKQQEKSDERLEKFFEAYEKDPDAFSKDAEYYNMLEDERNLEKKAGGGQLMGQAQQLANAGRGDDTMLMHVTPDEVAGIASLAPGMMTTNPQTGLPEAGFFKDLLGFGLPFLVGMIPGLSPFAAAAISGTGRTALEGGDFKDLLGNVAMAGLSNKVMGNIMDTGATNLANQATTDALTGQAGLSLADPTAMSMAGDAFTKAGIDPTAFQKAVSGGMDPSAYLSQVANPSQIASFQKGLSDVAMSNMPAPTFGGNIKNVGAAGFGGVKDALMSKAGLPLIGLEGLKAQNTAQNRFEDMLANMEREKEEREAELYRMHPENIPYYAREGRSLYKKRYIDGDYS